MSRIPAEVENLYYLAPFANVSSIARRGILPRNRAHGHAKEDIADPDVSARRGRKEFHGGNLHDFVPLFHTLPVAMSYARNEQRDSIAALVVNRKVVLRPGVYFTNKNAACEDWEVLRDLDELRTQVDWACVRASRIRQRRLTDEERQRRSAEVLVRDVVPFCLIDAVAVRTITAKDDLLLQLEGQDLGVAVRPELFP